MKLKKSVLFPAAVLLFGTAFTNAEGAARIKDNLTFFKLGNGVKVFVYNRPAAPLFTGMIYVDAGAAEEQVGETGLAHLLEHMAFKGTPWIGTNNWEAEKKILAQVEEVGSALTAERQKSTPDEARIAQLAEQLHNLQQEQAQYIVSNEYDKIVTRSGGQEVNASTDNDYTNYYLTLPSHKLELWAMMESQRMMYPAWREFYMERDVVAEERRMRVEDSPIGKHYEEFMAAAFRAHTYRNPVIGWMSDIYNLTISSIDDFYKRWYVPENMVLLLVGDVKAEEARPILEKYFGTIPPRPSPKKVVTVEPPQLGERRVTVQFEAQPQTMIGWHKPTFPDRDMYVIEVIQYLMTKVGRTSRLYERLVKKDAVCQEVDSWTSPGDKYPGMYMLILVPRNPHTNADAEKAAMEEIERIKREPVPEVELARIRNQIDANFLKELETNNGLARKLGYYYIASQDPDILDKMRDEMKKVTPQDIMRVAQKYFKVENRTVAELVSKQGAPPPGDKLNLPPAAEPEETTITIGQPKQTSSAQTRGSRRAR